MNLTREQKQEVLRGFRDHQTFCEESCAIRDKLGKTVPFRLGPAQLKLEEAIQERRRKKRPVRLIVLKARQVWISAGTAAEFFHDCAFVPGQKGLVVAHEVEAARNIFGYYQQLQANYKPFGGYLQTLPVLRNNDNLLAWQGGGYVKIATAGNLKTGRSFSLRFLHLSEFAFWRDAKTLMTGLLQAVPDDPNTIVIVESTANGQGNEFHKLCLEAMDPTVDSDWILVFFAWFEHPEYSIEPVDAAAFQASLSKEERELRDTYNLTLAQLNWRRWAIRNKCQGSPEIFRQEYPSNPTEAFLASGRPRFSHQHLNRMPAARKDAREAGTVGELEQFRNGPREVIGFFPGDRGALVVYKKPAPGKQYVIGIDVAEGIDASESLGASDPDYTVACVVDQSTGEQVAKLRGRIEPGAAAEYVELLARWYNWAYLVPESNGPGIAFLEGILRLGYPPALIYHRRPAPDEQFDDGDHTELSRIGWKTSQVTRVQLLSKLDLAIREFSIIITDPITLQEHLFFVTKANGRAEAQDGQHDDEVFAAALAVVGMETAPADRAIAGVKRDKPQGARAPKSSGTVTRYGRGRMDGRIDRGELVRF